MDQDLERLASLQSRETPTSARSLLSDSSVVFDHIDEFSKNGPDQEDGFENNSQFQTVLFRYRGKGGVISRKFCFLVSMAGFLVWVAGLILYSQGTAHKVVKQWNTTTNMVQISGQNITLQAYNSKNANVTLEDYRTNRFLPYRESIRWLTPKQYPQGKLYQKRGSVSKVTSWRSDHLRRTDNFGGYYLTRGPKNTFFVKQVGTSYSAQVLESGRFEYGNDFFDIDDIQLNPARPVNQKGFHLVVTDRVAQFRHLSFAVYWLFNALTNEFIPIQPPLEQVKQDEAKLGGKEILEKLHFAEFSPLGDYVLFGFDHNLFLQPLSGTQTDVVQITDSANMDVYNGKPDWVLEEEVWESDKLFWWLPNQEHLVFAAINDTQVQNYELDYFVKAADEVTNSYEQLLVDKVGDVNQYPVKTQIKYPKVGTSNPIISFFDYKIGSGEKTRLSNDISRIGDDFILYDAIWIDDDSFLTKQTDRTSSLLSKRVFKPKESDTFVEVSSVNVTKEYGTWVQKSSKMAILQKEGENGYIDEVIVDKKLLLAEYELATATEYRLLFDQNSGFEVVADSPVLVNMNQKMVYFLTNKRSTMDSHLASVGLENGQISPITSFDEDGLYDIGFSADGQYLNLYKKGPSQPWQKLVNMEDIHDHIEENNGPADGYLDGLRPINLLLSTEGTNFPTRVYKSVKVGTYSNNDAVDVNMVEIFPPNFQASRKYPLLVYVYGGPGLVSADKAFSVDFQDVVSATLDAVVLIIDPRGTGWRSRSFSRGNLGLWESHDVVTVTRDYIKVNKFIEKEKTAIWGWSYGGFTVLKTLGLDKGDVFKYAMAVAPVTNWYFYDSIYTERYMGGMGKHYDDANVQVEGLEKVQRFLLAHGTADNNVHLQNTLWLVDQLDQKGAENFDLHLYPDSDHAIAYHNADVEVFRKMLLWLRRAFSGRFREF